MARSHAMIPALLFAVTAFSIGPARAETVVARPFDVTANSAFAAVGLTLDTLIARTARTNANHLCLIGETLDDGSQRAWVYWREGKAIILWEPTASGIRDLRLSKRYLRLDKDVVASDDPRLAAGSSYLVTRRWTASLIADCAARGREFSIDKRQAIKRVGTSRK